MAVRFIAPEPFTMDFNECERPITTPGLFAGKTVYGEGRSWLTRTNPSLIDSISRNKRVKRLIPIVVMSHPGPSVRDYSSLSSDQPVPDQLDG